MKRAATWGLLALLWCTTAAGDASDQGWRVLEQERGITVSARDEPGRELPTLRGQGIIEGDAARTLRDRAVLAPGVAILADIDVKHSMPIGIRHDLAEEARNAAERGLADALIVTGPATGRGASSGDLKSAREAVPGVPILVGSGITLATVRETLRIADGAIVGTSLKEKGRARDPVDPARARELVAEARR